MPDPDRSELAPRGTGDSSAYCAGQPLRRCVAPLHHTSRTTCQRDSIDFGERRSTLRVMKDSANVPVLPPLIPTVLLALGVALHSVAPISVGPSMVVRPVGGLLLAVSIVLVVLAARELTRARTAFDVRRTTTCLVTAGVFRYSRNPVYLSMVLLCWAIGLLANSLVIALVAIPAGSALCLAVIRYEERYLASKFGADYVAYCGDVRRWF